MKGNNKITKIYGFHSVESAILNNPKGVKKIFLEKNRRDKRMKDLLVLLKENKINFVLEDKKVFEKISNKKTRGVIAEYEQSKAFVEKDLIEILKRENVFLLILDGVQDPHNLGAILRTANAVGVDAVIAPKDRAVGITSTVHKISSGAVEKTPFIQVTNLTQTLRQIKKEDVWVYGLSGESEKSLYQIDLKGRVSIVMGSEGKGLRRLTQENCDELVKIPMAGSVESLNVSVATGVALFEALRQRNMS